VPENYVYTDLATLNSLTLEVEGVGEFEVAQFSASFAANEVPTAAVMLALGRNARTQAPAAPHVSARLLRQMQKAFVWFEPKGGYDRDRDWPAGRRKIFEGYFTGFAYRKISGKVHVVASLTHWLAALGFGSALTKTGHVANPTALNAAAVIESLVTGGAGEGNYIGELAVAELVADTVAADLWVAVKNVYCSLTQVEAMPCGPQDFCGGTGGFSVNDLAQYALGKIEGPSTGCEKPYKYGVPLRIEDEGVSTVHDAIAAAIGMETIESYAGVTFWDKLVTQICPAFGLAVVPMVDAAVVAADLPCYSGGVWRDITTDEYDSYDLSRELHRPLRAVGVVAGYDSQTQAGVGSPGDNLIPVGGCYVEDSVAPGDGVILYVPTPAWLAMLQSLPDYALYTRGGGGGPARTAITTGATATVPVPPPDALGVSVNRLYSRYAHNVFVNQMLRGQTGSISGKLRFDIAPLSIVRLLATTEKFIGPGQDDLAETIVGCVQRVTVSISAESGMAGTTFQLSHVRAETENGPGRTSAAEHPLFGTAIHGGGKHGSPLVDDYEFPPPSGAGNDGAGPTDVT